MPGHKLKVNILTDGPRYNNNNEGQAGGNNQKKEEDLGEDTTNTYLHSAQDRTALMQKLSRNQDHAQIPSLGNGTTANQILAQGSSSTMPGAS